MEGFDYTLGMLAAMLLQLLFIAVAVLTHREEDVVMLELNDDQQYIVGVGRVLAEADATSLATTELLLIIAKQSFYIDELERELRQSREESGDKNEQITAKAP